MQMPFYIFDVLLPVCKLFFSEYGQKNEFGVDGIFFNFSRFFTLETFIVTTNALGLLQVHRKKIVKNFVNFRAENVRFIASKNLKEATILPKDDKTRNASTNRVSLVYIVLILNQHENEKDYELCRF